MDRRRAVEITQQKRYKGVVLLIAFCAVILSGQLKAETNKLTIDVVRGQIFSPYGLVQGARLDDHQQFVLGPDALVILHNTYVSDTPGHPCVLYRILSGEKDLMISAGKGVPNCSGYSADPDWVIRELRNRTAIDAVVTFYGGGKSEATPPKHVLRSMERSTLFFRELNSLLR